MQVFFWSLSYVAATILVAFSTRTLLTDKELGFPSTLLMMGLSNGISFVLCQLTVFIARCRRHCLGHDPEWQAANIFALMRLLQVGFGASAMCVSESYSLAFLMLYVVTLFMAGTLNASEKCVPTAVLPVVLALGGALLVVYDEGTYSLGGWSRGFDTIAYQLLSLMIGTCRLLMTQNFLCFEDPQGYRPKVSPLVLATRMMPASAIACFELACISYPGCFDIVLHLPDRGKIFALLCAIGFGNTVMLTSELQILQRHSATLLGFLLPCAGISVRILPMLLLKTPLPQLMQIGGVAYVVAFATYLGLQAFAGNAVEGDATNYQRLEGDGERRRDRPPRSSPRRERNGDDYAERSPRRAGGGRRVDFV